jgi:hypothetical protein
MPSDAILLRIFSPSVVPPIIGHGTMRETKRFEIFDAAQSALAPTSMSGLCTFPKEKPSNTCEYFE